MKYYSLVLVICFLFLSKCENDPCSGTTQETCPSTTCEWTVTGGVCSGVYVVRCETMTSAESCNNAPISCSWDIIGGCEGEPQVLSCSTIENVDNSSCNAQSGCEWVSVGECKQKETPEGGNDGQGGNDGADEGENDGDGDSQKNGDAKRTSDTDDEEENGKFINYSFLFYIIFILF